MVTESSVTASEKVALTPVPTATPLESDAGIFATTVGAVVSLAVASKTTSTQ
jgi:hypothetical protein